MGCVPKLITPGSVSGAAPSPKPHRWGLAVIDMAVARESMSWLPERKTDNGILGLAAFVTRLREGGVPVIPVINGRGRSDAAAKIREALPELGAALVGLRYAHKSTPNAFESEDFLGRLQEEGIGRLTLAGWRIGYCVLDTAIGADAHGIRIATTNELLFGAKFGDATAKERMRCLKEYAWYGCLYDDTESLLAAMLAQQEIFAKFLGYGKL